jgi:peptidyl-prolyl cis-trans isomerase SurA
MKQTSIFLIALAMMVRPAQTETINGIKAVIHDSIVTYQEIVKYTADAEELLRRRHRAQPEVYERELAKARSENLETRLERQLILHDFKTGGYNFPEPLLQDAVDDEIRTRYGGREKLVKSLQAMGMTYEKYRQQIREDIIVSALSGKNVSQEIIISPHKIESFYLANKDKYKVSDEVKLRVIVLNIPSDSDTETVRKRAEEIRGSITAGAAFSEMATTYSQGRQREQGGDWGWIQQYDVDGALVLRKELADPAFSLKPGEMSDIIVVGNSAYLMLVEDKRPAHVKALNEVRDEIENTLMTQERSRLRSAWIDRLKKKTFIRYF